MLREPNSEFIKADIMNRVLNDFLSLAVDAYLFTGLSEYRIIIFWNLRINLSQMSCTCSLTFTLMMPYLSFRRLIEKKYIDKWKE